MYILTKKEKNVFNEENNTWGVIKICPLSSTEENLINLFSLKYLQVKD